MAHNRDTLIGGFNEERFLNGEGPWDVLVLVNEEHGGYFSERYFSTPRDLSTDHELYSVPLGDIIEDDCLEDALERWGDDVYGWSVEDYFVNGGTWLTLRTKYRYTDIITVPAGKTREELFFMDLGSMEPVYKMTERGGLERLGDYRSPEGRAVIRERLLTYGHMPRWVECLMYDCARWEPGDMTLAELVALDCLRWDRRWTPEHLYDRLEGLNIPYRLWHPEWGKRNE